MAENLNMTSESLKLPAFFRGHTPIDLDKFSTVFDGEAPDHSRGAHKKILTLQSGGSGYFVISTVIGTNRSSGEPAISLNISLAPGFPQSNDVANFDYIRMYYFGPPDTLKGDIEICIPTPGTPNSHPSIIVGDGGIVFDEYRYDQGGNRRQRQSTSYDQSYFPQKYSIDMQFTPEELPPSINMPSTIAAFLNQISQNNFSKPKLFPR